MSQCTVRPRWGSVSLDARWAARSVAHLGRWAGWLGRQPSIHFACLAHFVRRQNVPNPCVLNLAKVICILNMGVAKSFKRWFCLVSAAPDASHQESRIFSPPTQQSQLGGFSQLCYLPQRPFCACFPKRNCLD